MWLGHPQNWHWGWLGLAKMGVAIVVLGHPQNWHWGWLGLTKMGVAIVALSHPYNFFFLFFLKSLKLKQNMVATSALTLHLGTGVTLLHRHLFDDMTRC
jgi:hypothetical protein